MKEITALLLDIEPSDIATREPYDVEPARIDLFVPEPRLDELGISVDEFGDFVDGLTAAGVNVEAQAIGTFMPVGEGTDPTTEGTERGYADLDDPDTGGTYASLLQ